MLWLFGSQSWGFEENDGKRESESGSETESEVGVRVGVRVVVGMNSHGVLRKLRVRVRLGLGHSASTALGFHGER